MRYRAGPLLILLVLAACSTPPQRAPVAPAPDHGVVGVASWYGPGFHGKLTANGERYDMDAMTAAHRSLPFDTRVEVTNLSNGRSAVFRINDRGPFVNGRIIDLSRRGAERLGFRHAGVARVRVQTVAANPVAATTGPATAPPAAYEAALDAALQQARLAPTPWRDEAAGVHGVIVPLTNPIQRQGLMCRNYRRTAVSGAGETVYVGRACRNGRADWEVTRERLAG